MAFLYANPLVENLTRDRLLIAAFAVDAQSLAVTIRYAEGHDDSGAFVQVGGALEAVFTGAEVQAHLAAAANPALYDELKAALYALLAGRLGADGGVE